MIIHLPKSQVALAALLSLLLACSSSSRTSSPPTEPADTTTDGAATTDGTDTTTDGGDTTPSADSNEVEMTTSMGTIVLQLDPDLAPNTVANFVEYVTSGHYDGTIFHRVIDGFMIQGGGFDKDYDQKPVNAAIQHEADTTHKNLRGTIAMARTGDPHSATAQFFINVVDNTGLDHTSKTPDGYGYTVFGKVIEGMDVVDAIRVVPTGAGGPFASDVPQTQVVIEKAVMR